MPTTIGRDEVRRLVDLGAQLVEVLPAEEYAEEHLAGAVNIPLRRIDRRAPELLDRTRPVVAYCFDAP
ncbi:MAG: rhodanese-like domain-containing protein [Actinobacteria bacterium]|nr:rhodanese-like domain-containing protein [Actinomycetota bacterium]